MSINYPSRFLPSLFNSSPFKYSPCNAECLPRAMKLRLHCDRLKVIFRLLYPAELLCRDAKAYPSEAVWLSVKKTDGLHLPVVSVIIRNCHISNIWVSFHNYIQVLPINIQKYGRRDTGRRRGSASAVIASQSHWCKASDQRARPCDRALRSGLSWMRIIETA